MAQEQEQAAARRIVRTIRAAAWVFLLVATARCDRGAGPVHPPDQQTTLRIGVSVGQMGSTPNPQSGVRQVAPLLTSEGLLRVDDDGRLVAWLAEGWKKSPDGLSIVLQIRPDVRFQDGTPVTASALASILANVLPPFMGPAASDLDRITATSERTVTVALKQPSAFVPEALEVQIRKPGPGGVSTGPFVADGPNSPTEMHANPDYYLGKSTVDRIAISTFPSVRAAWAELLRNHIDMLWEVGMDAMSSLENASDVTLFPYTRHYQFALIFNANGSTFRSKALRRALSLAIDRAAVVQVALDGHGVPSTGPIWPTHWAFDASLPRFTYDPQEATRLLAKEFGAKAFVAHGPGVLHFTCLVPPDWERIALAVKQQLEAVGVDMKVVETAPDAVLQAMASHKFDAVLIDAISGPSLFRPYLWWHSGTTNPAGFSSPIVDAALDRIRHSRTDDEYRAGVAAFQSAMMDDPPAIFLAWSQRARAVSNRFKVPVEPGRDVLATLRLWQPQADTQTRN